MLEKIRRENCRLQIRKFRSKSTMVLSRIRTALSHHNNHLFGQPFSYKSQLSSSYDRSDPMISIDIYIFKDPALFETC